MTKAEYEQAQIDRCLNCKKPKCNGNCAGFKHSTGGVHRKSPEEIDQQILLYAPHCETIKALSEATKINKGTVSRHCLALGITKYKRDIRRKTK